MKNNKWNISVVIAFIAVIISLLSTLISLKESRILLRQQMILQEQQEASVWPYLEHSQKITCSENSCNYEYIVINKGIGPAVINTVKYTLKRKEIESWGLGSALQKKYPNLVISQLGNTPLDGKVLAPGERHTVIEEKITKTENDPTNLSNLINNMNFHLEYCYCSVYGKCWQVYHKEDRQKIKQSDDCNFKENIR